MKKRGYIKKSVCENIGRNTKLIKQLCQKLFSSARTGRLFAGAAIVIVAIGSFLLITVHKNLQTVTLSEESFLEMGAAPISAVASKKGVIAIPVGVTKANPFVPSRNLDAKNVVPDVPTYDLVEPPEMINVNSDAARVMDTIVSGILYDKYSPSAILNIEGKDYLVKKGDVVNNYKVMSIMKDSVTVKLGSNVYKAGIGEILTEGTLNYNDVSNLNNKFGGVRK